ncbi:hypothetical protein GLOTRDRAFT_63670 [Gloeophyllum trabeum ATCC 11539]|uniref:Uncharacterized protein n=1 Tax=Gloeophyllum trabeum (strain ATCC 11539 / FP-39264 / Madison 617) TaxID=670483 RepID=S7RK93_GLOTA|nr:uncharacterized protein GLOTRDRAFT_63670 [Gloeophyllum trabeum ATCC 11539]EPQ53059.1 hypothetical protein GLOTRDRAFT_63670 [Gloeophyllum trabeum ATCC 11539]
MSGASNPAQPASTTAWTEPPWCGWIETTGDALLILEAARRGIIPRVTRRLVDSERKMITSGSVFVFDEEESGIKRWTDGFFWSPSRILGNFLLYRETDKRGAGHRGLRAEPSEYEGNGHNGQYGAQGMGPDLAPLSRPKGEPRTISLDKYRERTLLGSLTNSYKFKPDGLMKKTFSLTIGGVSQHLISYYRVSDVEQGRLRPPSSVPELAALDISPEYLDKTHFRNPPKVELGADGVIRYRGEADELDLAPRMFPSPSYGVPLLAEPRIPSPTSDTGSSGPGKRSKRYDPYNNGGKRRKSKNSQHTQDSSGDAEQEIQSPVASSPESPQSYIDQGITPVPHYVPYGAAPYGYYQGSGGYGTTSPPPMYGTAPYAPGQPVASPTATSPQAGSPTSPQGPSPPPPPYPSYASGGVETMMQPAPMQQHMYPYYPAPYTSYPPYSPPSAGSAAGPGNAWYMSYPPPTLPVGKAPGIPALATSSAHITPVEENDDA